MVAVVLKGLARLNLWKFSDDAIAFDNRGFSVAFDNDPFTAPNSDREVAVVVNGNVVDKRVGAIRRGVLLRIVNQAIDARPKSRKFLNRSAHGSLLTEMQRLHNIESLQS